MPGFPEGWFRVAAAREVPRDGVRAVRAFGRELVLYRIGSGAITAADAHCPHLGAHLGHGGRIDGGALRCPFHGLRFASDGRCLDRSKGRLSLWPVAEWQGQVMVWAGRAPSFELPRLDDGWTDPNWITLRLDGHVQDVAENGVDLGHFGAVHGYARVRDVVLEIDGVKLHSRFAFERKNPLWRALPAVGAIFDTDVWGLGCSVTRLSATRLDLRFRLLLLATQIDAQKFDFTIGVSAPRPLPSLMTKLLLRPIVNDVLQDREIWAHKIHLDRPALGADDAPLAQFRKYARQFYPE